MLPTLGGRIQTRVFMLAVFGGLVTLVLTPWLPHSPEYATTYGVLVAVLVLGIGWEVVYHVIQQFRWEKDWPTLLGLLTAINEGALVWILLQAGWVPWVDVKPAFSTFAILFLVVWLVIWVWVNGPMRVPLIRWRFRGGRIV